LGEADDFVEFTVDENHESSKVRSYIGDQGDFVAFKFVAKVSLLGASFEDVVVKLTAVAVDLVDPAADEGAGIVFVDPGFAVGELEDVGEFVGSGRGKSEVESVVLLREGEFS